MQGCIKLTIVGIALFTCSALFAQQTNQDTVVIPYKKNANKGKGSNDGSPVVSGTIKDAATGKPLAAVNVAIPDFSAALTDDNGSFTIKVPDFDATLVVSGEG